MTDTQPGREHPDGAPLDVAESSIWPFGVALGLTLLALGLVVHVLFGLAGVVLLGLGLWNWGTALRHG
jgi:4-amino-4-deoxy-L-arabinose transferase-like glycosyltransferase